MSSDESSTRDERLAASSRRTEQEGEATPSPGNALPPNAAVTAPHLGGSDTMSGATRVSASIRASQDVAWERIRSAIQRHVVYPRIGRRMRWQGRVVLGFGVGSSGQVHGVRVIRSSGDLVLDDSAVAAVFRAAPLPRSGTALEVELPIVFALR